MGWPFETASWEAAEGAYYAAVGGELVWVVISVVMCCAALFVGSRHELDAYQKAKNGN